MRTLLIKPASWSTAFVLWAVIMSIASSMAVQTPAPDIEIPHLDKVFHFTYFTLGGLTLATFILLKKSPGATITLRYVLPIVLISIFGALDEYHQSSTPGRSGNDLGDWIADTLGGIFGTLLANKFHFLLISVLSNSPNPRKK